MTSTKLRTWCARTTAAAFAAAALTATAAVADTVVINEFLEIDGPTTPDEWYFSDMRDDGTASIVSLVGAGGDLENNQPLPIGAALLTTGFNNGDKAEVSTFDDYGDAATLLDSIQLAYSYYKQTVIDGNAFAAPALKIALSAEGGTGDNYGQLVYEPYWNQPGGGAPPAPADAWQNVTIDPNTGSGDGELSGGWWWTGGFELPNGAGGPPLLSLAEWADEFMMSDPTDFANARVVGVSMAVGTYNKGQIGYFDAVTVTIPGGTSTTYNFEPVPEPSTFALAGLAGAAALVVGWRRKRAG